MGAVLRRILLLAVLGLLLLQLFFVGRVALMVVLDPRSTSFERSEAWRLASTGTLRWGMSCLHLVDDHLSGRVRSVERAAIGRRVSENEVDLLYLLKHGSI